MSVVRRDQNAHGTGCFLFRFCTRLGLDPTYTALGRAWPQGCCKTQEARSAGRPRRSHFSPSWSKGFRFSFWEIPARGGERVFKLIPTMVGWVLAGRKLERDGNGRKGRGWKDS